jgi:hypothetical protein
VSGGTGDFPFPFAAFFFSVRRWLVSAGIKIVGVFEEGNVVLPEISVGNWIFLRSDRRWLVSAGERKVGRVRVKWDGNRNRA